MLWRELSANYFSGGVWTRPESRPDRRRSYVGRTTVGSRRKATSFTSVPCYNILDVSGRTGRTLEGFLEGSLVYQLGLANANPRLHRSVSVFFVFFVGSSLPPTFWRPPDLSLPHPPCLILHHLTNTTVWASTHIQTHTFIARVSNQTFIKPTRPVSFRPQLARALLLLLSCHSNKRK